MIDVYGTEDSIPSRATLHGCPPLLAMSQRCERLDHVGVRLEAPAELLGRRVARRLIPRRPPHALARLEGVV
jgi:hypothetical protein